MTFSYKISLYKQKKLAKSKKFLCVCDFMENCEHTKAVERQADLSEARREVEEKSSTDYQLDCWMP